MDGFIFLHRSILDWEWYKDINCKILFIHCLLKANFSDKEWKGILIKRGQFFTSTENLSIELNLSIKQIRTSLKKLEKTKELGVQGASKGTMITVCNYDSYQSLTANEGQADGQAKGKQGASKGQQLKKDNKERKKEYIYPTPEEINSYCLGKGYNVDSKKIFDYYSQNDWKDSKGNKVLNWKSKILAVWCKDENKINKQSTEQKYKDHYNQIKEDEFAPKYAALLKRKKDILYQFKEIITIDELKQLSLNGNCENIFATFLNHGKTKDEFLVNLGIHVRKFEHD